MKKTKGRVKGGTAKKAAREGFKQESGRTAAEACNNPANRREEGPDPVDFAEVRKIVAGMVRRSATRIAEEVIKVAETGQLAPAKYLFEAVGLYPPGAEAPKAEDSLAYSLLKRMGLQPETGISDAKKDNIQGRESESPDGLKLKDRLS